MLQNVLRKLVKALEEVIDVSPQPVNVIKIVNSANVLVLEAETMFRKCRSCCKGNQKADLRKPNPPLLLKQLKDDAEDVIKSVKDVAVGRSDVEKTVKGLNNSVLELDCCYFFATRIIGYYKK